MMSPELESSGLESPLLRPSPGVGGSERIGVDEMLRRYAGELGPWQLRHFVLASLAWAVHAIHTMVMIFADSELPSNCGEAACGLSGQLAGDGCGLRPGTSTVVEWGLVCGERYKVGLVRSAFFAGCMLGCGIFGHLSDSFLGRKGSLITLCVINIISSYLTALSPTYLVYLLFRTLSGLSIGVMGPCAFILATEPIGPSKRAIAGMFVLYNFSIGTIILSAIAYAIPSWRMLYVACSIPTILFLVVAMPFVSESPRWYLIRGKSCNAMEVMKSIAKRNGHLLPKNVFLVLDSGKLEGGSGEREVSDSILDVVRSPITRRRLILLLAIDLLCSIVYYGINLNVGNLNANLYIGVTLNAVAEMPAFAISAFLVERIGRKPLAVGTIWLSGVFCVIGSLIGSIHLMGMAQMACGVMGIFGMAATFNLLLIYAGELFPTTVRSAALGCVEQAVQLGAIVAPMVVMMGGTIALGVFGACGVVAAVLAFYLPETRNKPLYDTMEGMEDDMNGGM